MCAKLYDLRSKTGMLIPTKNQIVSEPNCIKFWSTMDIFLVQLVFFLKRAENSFLLNILKKQLFQD